MQNIDFWKKKKKWLTIIYTLTVIVIYEFMWSSVLNEKKNTQREEEENRVTARYTFKINHPTLCGGYIWGGRRGVVYPLNLKFVTIIYSTRDSVVMNSFTKLYTNNIIFESYINAAGNDRRRRRRWVNFRNLRREWPRGVNVAKTRRQHYYYDNIVI